MVSTIDDVLKEVIKLTNELVETNRKLYEVCVRLHDIIEEKNQ